MGITTDGIKGEQLLFKLLHKKGYYFFQPDAIGLKNDSFFVFGAKLKARFKAPPFDGHGLDKRQVRARINFEEKTGIKSVLVVFDKETNEVFLQDIKKLEEGKHFDTRNYIRIYPIENFEKVGEFTSNDELVV